MESKAATLDLRHLSMAVGNFIRYWGFRRVHGAIWTQVYLSKSPLSCTDLAERLDLSKSLISPALAELEKWNLIRATPPVDDKTVLYEANEDLGGVIQHVLRSRESVMMAEITEKLSEFSKNSSKSEGVDQDRLKNLEQMTFSATLMLEMLLRDSSLLDLPTKKES